MRFASLWGLAGGLLATAALAAPGDSLVVTADVVNVRTGPGTGNPVLFRAARGQQATELTRDGDWIQVHLPDEATDGWIHRSLLAAAQPAPDETTEAPASNSAGSTGEALALFRGSVTELNARALAAAGVELFTGAESAESGAVQVMVTEAWDLIPEPGQESYTNALFDQWRAVAVGVEQFRLQVVDRSGTVVSEKFGPRTP